MTGSAHRVVVLSGASDERLAALAQAGSEQAFTAIVERYRARLLRYCAGYLPEAAAEDAVQQTFINAYQALTRDGDQAPVALRPWLYRIARNAALNVARDPQADLDQIPESLDAVRRPDEVYQQRERFRRVVGALLRLPPKQRHVIVRHALDGDSHDRIGTELGMSAGSIRQLVHRARRTLRETAAALLPTPLLRFLPMGGDAAELAGGTALAQGRSRRDGGRRCGRRRAAGRGAPEREARGGADTQGARAPQPVRTRAEGPGAHGAGAGRGRCPEHRLAEARLVGRGFVGPRTRVVRRFRGRVVRVRVRFSPLLRQRLIGLVGQRLIGLVRVFWLFGKWIIRVRHLGLRRGFAGVRLIRQRVVAVRLIRQRLIRRQRLLRQRLIRQRLIRQRLRSGSSGSGSSGSGSRGPARRVRAPRGRPRPSRRTRARRGPVPVPRAAARPAPEAPRPRASRLEPAVLQVPVGDSSGSGPSGSADLDGD